VKSKGKIILGIIVLLLVAGGVVASVRWTQRDLVTVQTTKVIKGDLVSQVTASGEIKPKTYINLGANAQGRITDLYVKEGDRVHKDQVVARIENIQATADVDQQKASINAALADVNANEAAIKAQDDAIKTQAATIDRAKSDLALAKINMDRAEQLVKEGVGPRQDYDQRKGAYDSAVASLHEAEARLSQMQSQRAQNAAQMVGTERRVAQAQAGLARLNDILEKHAVVAPLNGVVTSLPVRIGETVVMGIQNSAASTVMTIADMSIITAEVRVDETDIVNIHLGQPAEVTIDAIPNRTFPGHVIEIGNSAILRSSGLAASTSASSSSEAKDFKVVIGLDDPPEEIRPGLSCSTKITTATHKEVVSIPLQALTIRTKGDLEDAAKKKTAPADTNAAIDPLAEKERKEEIQGVFVIKGDKAVFTKVDTGITGSTDIEVLSGVEIGDQVVTGTYKAIRTMRDGTRIKVDNRTLSAADSKS